MTTTDQLNDPNLSEEEEDAIIGAFVRQHENEKLRKRWEKKLAAEHGLTRQDDKSKPGSAKIRKLVLGIVAVAACLLLLLIFLPGLLQEDGNELLAARLDEISLSTTRSLADNPTDSLRQVQLNAFNAGNLILARSAGATLIVRPDATTEDRLHHALVTLKSGNYPATTEQLSKLKSEDSIFTAEINYYLGLSLLAEKRYPEAREILGRLKPTDGQKLYAKAQELLAGDWD